MFEELSKIIREEVVATLFHVEVQQDEAEQALAPVEAPQILAYEHEQIGRNDPCWCGSGKKFKKCHGAQ